VASPLHQFEITPLIPLEIGGLNLAFTNSSLWMVIGVVVASLVMALGARPAALVPGRLQALSEIAYEYIAGMVRENIGPHGFQYFPLIFSIFTIVLMGNALGMLPFSFTYTSHLIVTASLALMIFLSVVVIGLARHGLHFFSLFLPPGIPVWMAPLIIPIEVISFLVRPVTLSVRLFANMMAGHILIKVIAGFAVGFAGLGVAGTALGILPTLFNSVLIGFELLIAFLQAYVFTILSCIYLKDTVELEH
jgi:F-type H+-transporting ATPase subunit a